MIRKTRWHKAGALMLSAAMGLSSFSAALPGGVVYAENGDVLTVAFGKHGMKNVMKSFVTIL